MIGEFKTIVHPTDFSDASVEAFVHALRFALVAKSKLYLVHIAETDDPHEQDGFPHIRETLALWHLLDPNLAAAEVANRLGIRVDKSKRCKILIARGGSEDALV